MAPRSWTRTAVTAAALCAGTAHAAVQFGFDADAQGWAVEQGGRLAYVASGGNAGGYLEFTDISSLDMLAVLDLGPTGANWSAYMGGTLTFDAKNLSGNSNFWGSFGEVTFYGAGKSTLTVDLVSADQPANDGAWHRYTIPLDALHFGANFGAVMGQVTRLTLRTEFAASDAALFVNPGFDERVGIDNITITAVPEPGAWALWLAGGAMLAARRRRRG